MGNAYGKWEELLNNLCFFGTGGGSQDTRSIHKSSVYTLIANSEMKFKYLEESKCKTWMRKTTEHC